MPDPTTRYSQLEDEPNYDHDRDHDEAGAERVPSLRASEFASRNARIEDPHITSERHHSIPISPRNSLSADIAEARPLKQQRNSSDDSYRRRLSSKWHTWSTPNVFMPWQHELDEKNPQSTAKRYDRHKQRRSLLINSTFQWLITAGFCAGITGCLKGYQALGALSVAQKHTFNLIITALSLGLGISLVSSLRSYANMMRWRLLATGWRSILEFELILGAESQTKVLRLLWAGRRSKPGFPWISRTQVICILWLGLNLGCSILVSMLGLTYSIDTSDSWVRTTTGLVTVVNLTTIDHQNTYGPLTVNTQQAAAQAYGIEGEDYWVDADTDPADQNFVNTIYTDDNESYFLVRFTDSNAEEEFLSVSSDRYVTTNATCVQYPIEKDISGNGTYLVYSATLDNGTIANLKEYIESYTPGLTTYILNTQHSCGDRCASILVYQATDEDVVVNSSFFKCTSYVSEVMGVPEVNGSIYALPDLQAKIWAGAIASTGFEINNDQRQWQTYSGNTQFSTFGEIQAYDAQVAIAQFSAYGLAAYDQNGIQMNVTGVTPVTSLILDVEWKWAIILLAVIPFLQFLAYAAVITWANKAIIKDDSHLSIAKLLSPIVNQIGEGGCILTGDDICEREELKDARVAYGFVDTDRNSNDPYRRRHLGVIFQHPEDGHQPTIERAWPDGWYNGPDDRVPRKRHRRMSI